MFRKTIVQFTSALVVLFISVGAAWSNAANKFIKDVEIWFRIVLVETFEDVDQKQKRLLTRFNTDDRSYEFAYDICSLIDAEFIPYAIDDENRKMRYQNVSMK